MKRVHINITVTDLDRSVGFYTTLFGTGPTVLKQDYAKWMLEDPRLNLSISTSCCSTPGVDHLGIQTETADELDTLAGRLKAAVERHVDQTDANCCYGARRQDLGLRSRRRGVGDLPHHRRHHALRRGSGARDRRRTRPNA